MADQDYDDYGYNSIIYKNRHLADICVGVIESTGAKPGYPCIKGTADKQIQKATEDATNVLGIFLEPIAEDKDIDTAYTAGDVARYVSLQSKGVHVHVPILKNTAAIAKGDKLTVASTPFDWTLHPDDLDALIPTGGSTVKATTAAPSCTISGFRDNPSFIIAWESLGQTNNERIIEAVI